MKEKNIKTSKVLTIKEICETLENKTYLGQASVIYDIIQDAIAVIADDGIKDTYRMYLRKDILSLLEDIGEPTDDYKRIKDKIYIR